MTVEYEAEQAALVAAVTRPRAEAMAAAKWWVDQLRGGEMGSAGDAMIDFMRNMVPRNQPTERGLDTLEAELAAGVEGELVRREGWWKSDGCDTGWHWGLGIDVDYGPCAVLAKAAERAGVRVPWPVKTNCTVDRGRIVVRRGYGGGIETAWISEEGARHWATVALERCRDDLAGIRVASRKIGLNALCEVANALDCVHDALSEIGGSR